MPRRGRRGLGGARASRAARLGARARKGRPRAAAFPPAAAQPSSQRPELAGPAPSRAAAAAGAVTCRPRRPGCPRGGAPAGLVSAPSRPQPLCPKFQPQKQFPDRAGSGVEAVAGLEYQRRSESAPTWPGNDSARAKLSGHVHNFAPPQSVHRAEEQALLNLRGKGLPGPPRQEECQSSGPKPGAVRGQPRRRGGCSCAQECGLPPRQLGRAAGSRWDHLFPAPAGSTERAVPAAPPPLQLASSNGRSRRAAAAAG